MSGSPQNIIHSCLREAGDGAVSITVPATPHQILKLRTRHKLNFASRNIRALSTRAPLPAPVSFCDPDTYIDVSATTFQPTMSSQSLNFDFLIALFIVTT